jgi:hypothetical protein
MASKIVQSAGGSKHTNWRERIGVLAAAGVVITAIGAYWVLNTAGGTGDSSKGLLPYQALVRTLPDADQRLFHTIRQGLTAAASERAHTSAWPDAPALAARGVAPFAPTGDGADYQWARLQQGTIVDYFGQPRDPAAPAWLLEIQEPEPGMLPDTAPNDEEHHRLPDGTVLHIYVWMHRLGRQVPVEFVRQPQTSGWTEVFSEVPNPMLYNRR